MPHVFIPLPTDIVRDLQAGAPDAYGHTPERAVSDGDGIPCRHCLKSVPAGKPYLIVAHRPFTTEQPYAETGPIFLCAEACEAADASGTLPEILESPDYIVRGYDTLERIVYGTGGVVETRDIGARADALLADPSIAFVHVRSSRNNCYQVRIDRVETEDTGPGAEP